MDKEELKKRLQALRQQLRKRELDGFIIPSTDEHLSEYIAPYARRLKWLTGFGGSMGTTVVLREHAALFTDGRYILQAQEELDLDSVTPHHFRAYPVEQWLSEHVSKDQRIGYDPWLHNVYDAERLSAACHKKQAHLVPVTPHPVDAVWLDQPLRPQEPIKLHPLAFAGQASNQKRQQIAQMLKDEVTATVLTDTLSIAWLLNIRGQDIPFTPVALAYLVLHRDASVDLFIHATKVPTEVQQELGDTVRFHAYEDLEAYLTNQPNLLQVQIDPMTCPVKVAHILEQRGARIIQTNDPCVYPKAIKNTVEMEGARAAHRRDGAALAQFLAWFDTHVTQRQLWELDIVRQLEYYRTQQDYYRGPSFMTIAGSGPHGAIVHYAVSDKTNRPIQSQDIVLIDSGGQYLDGTTDITRTIAVGAPTPEQRDRFTRVLKGHIALATARFPDYTSGGNLDVLARQFLWHVGLDYDHSTGHGVGSYLSVHEGPQRISAYNNNVILKPGMIISNEPGYYKANAYGIRIENLVTVVPSNIVGSVAQPSGPMYEFETLTLVPIDQKLIQQDLLTRDEIAWLNHYHAKVYRIIGPMVDDTTRLWLAEATQALH